LTIFPSLKPQCSMVSELHIMQNLCLLSQLAQLPITASNVAAGIHHT
jgi:hypothetical protein